MSDLAIIIGICVAYNVNQGLDHAHGNVSLDPFGQQSLHDIVRIASFPHPHEIEALIRKLGHTFRHVKMFLESREQSFQC